jgi:hypothetical protein
MGKFEEKFSRQNKRHINSHKEKNENSKKYKYPNLAGV